MLVVGPRGGGRSACCPRRIHIRPISGLVSMLAPSCQTTVSSAGSSAKSVRRGLQLGLPLLVAGAPRSVAVAGRPGRRGAAMPDRLRAYVEVVAGQEGAGPAPRRSSGCGASRSCVGQLGGHPVDDDGPTQAGSRVKRRPGWCPATASTPSRWNRLTQRLTVRELQNKYRGDGLPGVAIGQQQQDVGAEADLGIGVLTISIEQRLAPPGVEGHATCHKWGQVPGGGTGFVYPIVQASSTFPFAWSYLAEPGHKVAGEFFEHPPIIVQATGRGQRTGVWRFRAWEAAPARSVSTFVLVQSQGRTSAGPAMCAPLRIGRPSRSMPHSCILSRGSTGYPGHRVRHLDPRNQGEELSP